VELVVFFLGGCLRKYTLEEEEQQEREAASGFFTIGRQQRRSAEENHKKERTKMFHDLKRPVTIHSMEGQNKKFVRYSLRPSLSSAVPSFEFWRRIRANLVCFFLFCFFFSRC
jgi:hypothetical protein